MASEDTVPLGLIRSFERIMWIDTETTGLFSYKNRADAEGEPRMAEIASVITDGQFNIIEEFQQYIRPDGWVMTEEGEAVNGLTTEFLMENGQPVTLALDAYERMHAQSKLIIGFNVAYDQKMLRGEMRRAGRPDRWNALPVYSPMAACTKHCKLPPTEKMMARNRNSFKPPKLVEAVLMMLNRQSARAHGATSDVLDTIDVTAKLLELEGF